MQRGLGDLLDDDVALLLDLAPGDGHIEIDDDAIKSIDSIIEQYVDGGSLLEWAQATART